MKKVILYILLSSYWISAYAQVRPLTLIIDTLSLNSSSNFRLILATPAFDSDLAIPYTQYDTLKTKDQWLHINSYPNYAAQFTLVNDSVAIILPLDNGGSYLCLKNLSQLWADTLRISSWTLYDNCFNDTLITTTNYWKVKYLGGLQEEIGSEYKKKREIKVTPKNCEQKVLTQLQLSINQKHYQIDNIQAQKRKTLLEIGCGYSKYKFSWDQHPPKRKVIRYSRSTSRYNTLYIVTLIL